MNTALHHRRLAVVSDAIYPYNKGGKETRIHELTTRMAKKGWDVHVYTMKWWNGPDTIVESDRTLHAICPKIPLYNNGRRSIQQGIIFGLSCFSLLFRSFDIVEADSMPYFPIFSLRLVTWIRRKPLIAVWHEVWSKEYWKSYLGWKGIVAYWLERVSAQLPNKIISVSKQTNELIVNEYRRKDGVVVIENGLDTLAIDSVKPSKQKVDFLFAGRLLTHKNVDVLIRAFALLAHKNMKLTLGIVGDGPEYKNLKQLAKQIGLEKQITFFGFSEEITEVWSHMKSSKVFVLPSSREGFGITVLEANACGIPVVTVHEPNNAAQYLITKGENGYISSLSENDLSQNMEQALKNSNKVSTKCKKSASQYNWDRITKELNTFYEKI